MVEKNRWTEMRDRKSYFSLENGLLPCSLIFLEQRKLWEKMQKFKQFKSKSHLRFRDEIVYKFSKVNLESIFNFAKVQT